MAQPLHLLLVEDDDNIAFLMRRSLERAGHQVTRCATAEAALLVLGHSRFDLISLDQILPDMRGLELLQTLRREGVNTPVIMVAPYADESLIAQALRAGALDFVVQDGGLSFLNELPERMSNAVRAGAAG
jgi:two-component system OmpR family response regulator